MKICPFVVAKEDINDYSNIHFHPDYSGAKFDIEAGCILAVGRQVDFTITKHTDDLSNVPSIFSIVFNADQNVTQMIVDIDNPKIVIMLPMNDFTNYKALNNNVLYQPILISTVVIPALIYTLEEIKNRDPESRYELEDYGWYIALQKVLSTRFACDIASEEFSSQNMLKLAQRLINEPLHEALKQLANGSNEEEGAN